MAALRARSAAELRGQKADSRPRPILCRPPLFAAGRGGEAGLATRKGGEKRARERIKIIKNKKNFKKSEKKSGRGSRDAVKFFPLFSPEPR